MIKCLRAVDESRDNANKKESVNITDDKKTAQDDDEGMIVIVVPFWKTMPTQQKPLKLITFLILMTCLHANQVFICIKRGGE